MARVLLARRDQDGKLVLADPPGVRPPKLGRSGFAETCRLRGIVDERTIDVLYAASQPPKPGSPTAAGVPA